jgi:ribose transport system ATP-binding protein
MKQASLLSLSQIEKLFPGVKALDKVDFSIDQGEVVALIGENGAGKSTLMKILGGVHTPNGGVIKVNGQPVSINSVTDANALGIGFIHQELNVVDNINIAGNVYLGREPCYGGPLRLIDRKKMALNTAPILARLGLHLSPDEPLNTLTIAQQQMVEIAKALSMDARLIIMDEPTSSLTLTETDNLMRLIAQLKTEGVAIIYISHRLGEVIQCADRVVCLRDGCNAGHLLNKEINHDNMVKMMVGRQLADFYIAPAQKATETMLSVSNYVTTAYPNKTISFKAKKGEIFGFAGLVGAGRTELMQAVFGVDRHLGGDMTLNGAAINIQTPRDAIAQGIYLIPEDRRRFGCITEMTVKENITLCDMQKHLSGGLINAASEALLAKSQADMLNVKTLDIDTLVKNLSGGNQQKVVLAKWMAMAPKVFIFDEPTRGIDIGARSDFYHIMRRLADSGVLVLMVSSDMEEILGVCDRIAVMHEGDIAGVVDRDDFNEEVIMRLAVGQKNTGAEDRV